MRGICKIAAFLLSGVLALAQVSLVCAAETVRNESFNSGETGQPPQGWRLDGTDEYNKVEVTEEDGERVLRLKAVGAGYPSALYPFSALAGDAVLEGKLKVKQSGGDHVLSVVDASGVSAELAVFGSDSFISVFDGNVATRVLSYSLNTWYRTAVTVNTEKKSYSLYVNGEEVMTNCRLPEKGAGGVKMDYSGGICGIKLANYQSADYGYTTALWDDIRAYIGGTPMRDEQFETTSVSVSPNQPSNIPVQSVSVGKQGFRDGQGIIMLTDGSAVVADERLISYDRFVSDFTGRIPQYGWNNYTAGNLATVETISTESDPNNKAIRMENVNTNTCNEQKVFLENPIDYDITVEAKFYVESYAGEKMINFTDSPNFCQIITLGGDGNIKWIDGTQLGTYAEKEWVKVRVALDVSERTADCYINDRQVCSAKPYPYNGTRFTAIRFGSTGGVCWLDDVYLYRGTQPMDTDSLPDGTFGIYKNLLNDDSAVLQRLGNQSIAMKTDSRVAYVNGSRTVVDINTGVMPRLSKDKTYVPLRFILENLGFSIEWEEQSQTVHASDGERDIFISLSDGTMTSDFEGDMRTYECLMEHDRCLVPIRVLANWLGKKIYWNSDGVFILCDNAQLFDEDADSELIDKLYRMMTFERPTGQQILNAIQQKYPNYAHNRLYLTDERLERINRRYQAGDEETVKWVDKYVADAKRYIGQDALDYKIPDGKRLLDTSRAMEGRFIMYAVAYRLSGDTALAEQCWKEMQHIAEYPNWNETHFLDTAEMCRGFAIAFDTFYDWMNDEQRALCVKTIKEKALYPALYEYRYGNGATHNEWANTTGNWNPVCNAGMIIGAVAIAEYDEALAAEIIESALIGLEGNLVHFAPDGAWYEGPGYWHYTIEFISYALDAIYTSTGSVYNYLNVGGLGETAMYYLAVTGPGGTFNYGDMTPQYIKAPELYWYAEMMQNGQLAAIYRDIQQENGFGMSLTDVLHYDEELAANADVSEMPFDQYFRKWWIGSLRSSWNSSDATYIAFQGGRPNAGHSQMSMGNFVFDSMGERWALDLGYDDYNIGYLGLDEDSRSWWIYRKSAEGHNCFLINPDDQLPQIYNSDSPITAFETEEQGGYGVLDLTPAYARNAIQALRGFRLDRTTDIVTIQDEIEMRYANSEYYWFMHTDAQIEISADGKQAILSKGGKRMWVGIQAPSDAVFTVMDTKVLPSSGDSGVRDKEAENEGVQKLAIHLTGLSGKNTVSVSMTGLKDDSADKPIIDIPQVTPINQWTIPKGELVHAELDSIQVDDEPIALFSADRYNYTVKLPFGTTSIPAVEAKGEGDISVSAAQDLPGASIVTVKQDGRTDAHYIVSFKVQPLIGKEPDGAQRLTLKNVKASASPQAENPPEHSIDNDYDTRWAASGEQWIMYELEGAKTVDSFMTAWISGDARLEYFDMQTSMDGKTWTTLFSGESSGETAGPESYMVEPTKAKYVRLKVHGNSTSSWSSLAEFAVYGK